MKKNISILILLFLTVLLAACGPAAMQEIVAVTPMPAGVALATATPSSVAPPAANPVDEPTSLATATPLSVQLPQGQAAAIAAATDVAMQPVPNTRLVFDESPVRIAFDEFYDGYDIRKGLLLSDKLLSLDGQEVIMEGYMAPPLKPELDYFVLTRIRLEFCPFCSTAADWPNDIALVYMMDEPVIVTLEPIRLRGRIEVGPSIDQETGMVSLVRIYALSVEIIG
jgi:hypothetical protein